MRCLAFSLLGRDWLWRKTRAALHYVHDRYANDYDFFVKADDDTYIIMENLRLLLTTYDANDPTYLGCRFRPIAPEGYNAGGAGYVLSRTALRQFVNDLNRTLCPYGLNVDEDATLGRCLATLGIYPGDTRDRLGQYRFLPIAPEAHLLDTALPWMEQYAYWPLKAVDRLFLHAVCRDSSAAPTT